MNPIWNPYPIWSMDEMDKEKVGQRSVLRSFFSNPLLDALKKLRRVILEKVELHGFGDFQNQVAVEWRLIENLVDIVAGAMNLTRQPAHATLVGLQLLADEVPDVDVAFCGFHCLAFCLGFGFVSFQQRNSVKLSSLYVRSRLWNAFHTISNKDSR